MFVPRDVSDGVLHGVLALACALSLLASGAARAHAESASVQPATRPAGKSSAKASTKPGVKADSKADDGNEARPISIAVIGGYGLIVDDTATEGINPFRVGFGVRGGYDVGAIYIGARFLFFLGQTRGQPDGSERSADEWLVGLEGGYTFAFGPLTIRPELGFGLAFSSSEAVLDQPMPEPVDTSSNDPYFELGLALELNVARDLFFGLQARAVAVLEKQAVRGDHELIGVPLLAACGMRF